MWRKISKTKRCMQSTISIRDWTTITTIKISIIIRAQTMINFTFCKLHTRSQYTTFITTTTSIYDKTWSTMCWQFFVALTRIDNETSFNSMITRTSFAITNVFSIVFWMKIFRKSNVVAKNFNNIFDANCEFNRSLSKFSNDYLNRMLNFAMWNNATIWFWLHAIVLSFSSFCLRTMTKICCSSFFRCCRKHKSSSSSCF